MTGPLIFILPPLFYTKMLRMERKLDKRNNELALAEANLNDTEFLLKSFNGYGTIEPSRSDHTNFQSTMRKGWLIVRSEYFLAFLVIFFGIAATFTSTICNILDVKDLKQFWSPCIQNISLSYQLIPQQSI